MTKRKVDDVYLMVIKIIIVFWFELVYVTDIVLHVKQYSVINDDYTYNILMSLTHRITN